MAASITDTQGIIAIAAAAVAVLALLGCMALAIGLRRMRRAQRVVMGEEGHRDLVAHAAEKLARKSLDLIVANDVSADVFGADTNQVTFLWSDGRREDLPRMPKTHVAEQVLDAVAALLAQRSS